MVVVVVVARRRPRTVPKPQQVTTSVKSASRFRNIGAVPHGISSAHKINNLSHAIRSPIDANEKSLSLSLSRGDFSDYTLLSSLNSDFSSNKNAIRSRHARTRAKNSPTVHFAVLTYRRNFRRGSLEFLDPSPASSGFLVKLLDTRILRAPGRRKANNAITHPKYSRTSSRDVHG